MAVLISSSAWSPWWLSCTHLKATFPPVAHTPGSLPALMHQCSLDVVAALISEGTTNRRGRGENRCRKGESECNVSGVNREKQRKNSFGCYMIRKFSEDLWFATVHTNLATIGGRPATPIDPGTPELNKTFRQNIHTHWEGWGFFDFSWKWWNFVSPEGDIYWLWGYKNSFQFIPWKEKMKYSSVKGKQQMKWYSLLIIELPSASSMPPLRHKHISKSTNLIYLHVHDSKQ